MMSAVHLKIYGPPKWVQEVPNDVHCCVAKGGSVARSASPQGVYLW